MRYFILITVLLLTSSSKAQSIRKLLKYTKKNKIFNNAKGYVFLDNEYLTPLEFRRKLRKGKRTSEAYDLLQYNFQLSRKQQVVKYEFNARILATMLKYNVPFEERLDYTTDCYLDYFTFKKVVKVILGSTTDSVAAVQLIKPVLMKDYGNIPKVKFLKLLKKYVLLTGDHSIMKEL